MQVELFSSESVETQVMSRHINIWYWIKGEHNLVEGGRINTRH